MTKRGDLALRPPKGGEWKIRLATSDAAKGWDDCVLQAPGALATLFDRLTEDPRKVTNFDRQGRLKGSLGIVEVKGKQLEQWQYELTGGGRIWFAPDDEQRTVWVVLASLSHPKATE